MAVVFCGCARPIYFWMASTGVGAELECRVEWPAPVLLAFGFRDSYALPPAACTQVGNTQQMTVALPSVFVNTVVVYCSAVGCQPGGEQAIVLIGTYEFDIRDLDCDEWSDAPRAGVLQDSPGAIAPPHMAVRLRLPVVAGVNGEAALLVHRAAVHRKSFERLLAALRPYDGPLTSPMVSVGWGGGVPFGLTFKIGARFPDKLPGDLLRLAAMIECAGKAVTPAGAVTALRSMQPGGADAARCLVRALCAITWTFTYQPDYAWPANPGLGLLPANLVMQADLTGGQADCEDYTATVAQVWKALCECREEWVRAFVAAFDFRVAAVATERPDGTRGLHCCALLLSKTTQAATVVDAIVRCTGQLAPGSEPYAPPDPLTRERVLQRTGATVNEFYARLLYLVDLDRPCDLLIPACTVSVLSLLENGAGALGALNTFRVLEAPEDRSVMERRVHAAAESDFSSVFVHFGTGAVPKKSATRVVNGDPRAIRPRTFAVVRGSTICRLVSGVPSERANE